MRRLLPSLLVGSAIALTLSSVHADEKTEAAKTADAPKHARLDEAAPAFTLKDITGTEHSLANYKGKYVVLEWTNFDCPFVRKHYASGNMQTLQKEYAKKGVVWLRICSSAAGKQGYYKTEEIQKKLAEEKSMHTAYLVDEDGKVGRLYGAKTTPHMFIINPEGALIFAGGIDDKPSTNVADIKTATNYVKGCLEAAMTGKTVATKSSTPYGCSVKYKDA